MQLSHYKLIQSIIYKQGTNSLYLETLTLFTDGPAWLRLSECAMILASSGSEAVVSRSQSQSNILVRFSEPESAEQTWDIISGWREEGGQTQSG